MSVADISTLVALLHSVSGLQTFYYSFTIGLGELVTLTKVTGSSISSLDIDVGVTLGDNGLHLLSRFPALSVLALHFHSRFPGVDCPGLVIPTVKSLRWHCIDPYDIHQVDFFARCSFSSLQRLHTEFDDLAATSISHLQPFFIAHRELTHFTVEIPSDLLPPLFEMPIEARLICVIMQSYVADPLSHLSPNVYRLDVYTFWNDENIGPFLRGIHQSTRPVFVREVCIRTPPRRFSWSHFVVSGDYRGFVGGMLVHALQLKKKGIVLLDEDGVQLSLN
jgi:hypothetical protein